MIDGTCSPMQPEDLELVRIVINDTACEDLLYLEYDPGDMDSGWPDGGVDPSPCDDLDAGVDCPHLEVHLDVAAHASWMLIHGEILIDLCTLGIWFDGFSETMFTPIAPN